MWTRRLWLLVVGAIGLVAVTPGLCHQSGDSLGVLGVSMLNGRIARTDGGGGRKVKQRHHDREHGRRKGLP